MLGALAGEPTQQAGPAVIVLPFQPLAGGEGGQLLASGISAGLMADRRRFDGLPVCAGLPESQGAAGAAGTR
jgi:TolB-like protein